MEGGEGRVEVRHGKRRRKRRSMTRKCEQEEEFYME